MVQTHHHCRAASPLRPLRQLLQRPPAAPLPEPAHPLGCLPSQAQSHPGRLNTTRAAVPGPPAIIDSNGKLTLRYNGRLHHIGIGRTHPRTPILMLINGRDIRIIHATTGQIIRELILNPAVDYQRQGVRKPRKYPP
jgi:hypothetical protein